MLQSLAPPSHVTQLAKGMDSFSTLSDIPFIIVT